MPALCCLGHGRWQNRCEFVMCSRVMMRGSVAHSSGFLSQLKASPRLPAGGFGRDPDAALDGFLGAPDGVCSRPEDDAGAIA